MRRRFTRRRQYVEMFRAIVFFISIVSACTLFAEAPRLDLYLLIGQSNMAGRGKLTDENRLSTDGVWKLDKNDRWVAATEPLHFDKPAIAGAGLGMSFARALREKEPSVEIGLIPCAVGGTPLSRWMPGKDLYTNAVRRAKIAQRQGAIKAILWHQGEGDCGSVETRESYAARLATMVKALRAELGLSEDVPFLAGELGPYLKDRYKGSPHLVINEQLKSCEKTVPNFHCISSEGLTPNSDILHFNTESLRIFGRRYAEVFVK